MTTDIRLSPEALVPMELFAGLDLPALEGIAAAARARRLPADTQVFHQGGEGLRAHAVIEGGVRISQSGRDGAQILVRLIGPGEMFGTVSLFTDGRYPADAVTLTETLETSWSEAELLGLMMRHPLIGINAVRILGRRLQEAQDRVRELATQRAERRIAHALVRLARQAGQGGGAGTTIRFPLRRKDIADMAGTTLYTASRTLRCWEKGGLIVSRNRSLTVRSLSELQRIAEDVAG